MVFQYFNVLSYMVFYLSIQKSMRIGCSQNILNIDYFLNKKMIKICSNIVNFFYHAMHQLSWKLLEIVCAIFVVIIIII